jgi:hypothetical protein
MAGRGVIAARQNAALEGIREILEKHHPEAAERLDVYTPNGIVPNSYKMNAEFHLHTAESVQMLAELLDPILEDRKPKKRGRKPKSQATKSKGGHKSKEG